MQGWTVVNGVVQGDVMRRSSVGLSRAAMSDLGTLAEDHRRDDHDGQGQERGPDGDEDRLVDLGRLGVRVAVEGHGGHLFLRVCVCSCVCVLEDMVH